MKFEIITIFPDFFRGPLDYGIVRRAREAGLIEIGVHDLREFTTDKHRTVDDRPFGGGEGMVLKPEPLFKCVESLGVPSREERREDGAKESVVLLSAQGEMFTQAVAQEELGLGADQPLRRPARLDQKEPVIARGRGLLIDGLKTVERRHDIE